MKILKPKYFVVRILIKFLMLCLIVIYLPFLILTLILSAIALPFSKKFSITIASSAPLILWSIFNIIFRLSFDIKIPEVPKGNAIVISNHLFAGDFMFINAINKHTFKNAKYAIKKSLQFFPIFYQGCVLTNFLIIKRNYEEDHENILRYFRTMRNIDISYWFVLFPEGHRLTPQRLAESREFSKSRGLDILEHVLLPRVKGFSLIAKTIDTNHVPMLLDFTMFCYGEIPTFTKVLLTGHVYKYNCDLRIVKTKSIGDPVIFLLDAFKRKDLLISNWKKKN